MPACCPSPVSVHHSVSTQPVFVVRSRCPAVRCPARPVSGHLVPSSRIRLSGRLVSGRLVSARPSCRVHLVPPQPGGGVGDTSVRRGNLTTGRSRVPCDLAESLQRLGRRPEEAWMRAMLRRSCVGRRGASAADLGRVVLGRGGCARPTREARPPPRGASSLATELEPGELADARRSRTTAWLPLGLEPRLRSVVVVEPDAGVDGLGRTNEFDGADGRAAPARPSQVTGGSQLNANGAVTCKNGGGRDRV
jgi:hypothetical protein